MIVVFFIVWIFATLMIELEIGDNNGSLWVSAILGLIITGIAFFLQYLFN